MLIYMMMIDSETDKSKFEQIYMKYKGLMFYVANDILHNEHDAEDAVHQAFIKIAENIKKIMEVDCPKTKGYVVTIVENKAIDLYRKNKRQSKIELLEDIGGIDIAYSGEDSLVKCMLKLNPRYREIIFLKYHHGYTLKEIARILEISEANAIKLDQRAKKKLMNLCKEEGIL